MYKVEELVKLPESLIEDGVVSELKVQIEEVKEEIKVEETQEGASAEDRLKQLEGDYTRLQRKLTKTIEELKKAEEPIQTLAWIRARPELADNVQELIREYKGEVKEPPSSTKSESLEEFKKGITEAVKYLSKRNDYDKYEKEILNYAEAEDYDIEDPRELKKAYLLWRGENVEKIAQDLSKQEQKKITQKQELRNTTPVLQGGGSSISKPAPNYQKMSAKEVLDDMGLKLFKED